MQVAVIGPASASAAETDAAHAVGAAVAADGHVVVTGGRGGIMAAATRGAAGVGGVTLALLPDRHGDPVPHDAASTVATVVVPTGLGESRNALVVAAADVVVAVGGAWGTLSEIALAARAGTPVVVLDGWDLADAGRRTGGDPLVRVATADDAVTAVRGLLAAAP